MDDRESAARWQRHLRQMDGRRADRRPPGRRSLISAVSVAGAALAADAGRSPGRVMQVAAAGGSATTASSVDGDASSPRQRRWCQKRRLAPKFAPKLMASAILTDNDTNIPIRKQALPGADECLLPDATN